MVHRKSTTKGFKQTASLLAKRIRVGAESRGFSETRLLTRWSEIAGADTAAIARPISVSYGRKGFGATLTLLTTGAHAPILEMQKEQLRTKVNAVYGHRAISSIRITQTAPTGFADGQMAFTGPHSAPRPPQPDAMAYTRGQAAAQDVQSADLRAALAQLGANIISRSKSSQET